MTEKLPDENWVKKYVKAYLDKLGAYHFPTQNNGMGVSGIPDRICVLNGLFIGIEAKRPGRRGQADRGCSALQVKSLRGIADKGGFAWVVDSDEDMDELDAQLDNFFSGLGATKCNLDMDYWKKK